MSAPSLAILLDTKVIETITNNKTTLEGFIDKSYKNLNPEEFSGENYLKGLQATIDFYENMASYQRNPVDLAKFSLLTTFTDVSKSKYRDGVIQIIDDEMFALAKQKAIEILSKIDDHRIFNGPIRRKLIARKLDDGKDHLQDNTTYVSDEEEFVGVTMPYEFV